MRGVVSPRVDELVGAMAQASERVCDEVLQLVEARVRAGVERLVLRRGVARRCVVGGCCWGVWCCGFGQRCVPWAVWCRYP